MVNTQNGQRESKFKFNNMVFICLFNFIGYELNKLFNLNNSD